MRSLRLATGRCLPTGETEAAARGRARESRSAFEQDVCSPTWRALLGLTEALERGLMVPAPSLPVLWSGWVLVLTPILGWLSRFPTLSPIVKTTKPVSCRTLMLRGHLVVLRSRQAASGGSRGSTRVGQRGRGWGAGSRPGGPVQDTPHGGARSWRYSSGETSPALGDLTLRPRRRACRHAAGHGNPGSGGGDDGEVHGTGSDGGRSPARRRFPWCARGTGRPPA